MRKWNRHNARSLAKKKDNLAASLSTIFRDADGAVPDLRALEPRRKSPVTLIAFGFLAFLCVLITAAWTGFVLFRPLYGFQGKGVEIDIEGPERVVLGEETTYVVNWRNVSSHPIVSADLRVSFPIDFTLIHTQPNPTNNGLMWQLGAISIGGRGKIILRGIFTGALGMKTAIQAVGTYRPESFTRDFETLATRAVEYTGTVLKGSVDIPQNVLPGDRVSFVYTIQHTGGSPLQRLEAQMTFPRGFVREVSASSTVVDEQTIRIPLGDLVAGSTTTVAVSGKFTSGHTGEAPFRAEVGRSATNGAFQPIQRTDASCVVLSGDLNLKLVANGSDADRSINVGDVLRFAIGYENTTNETIKDVQIQFTLQPIVASGTDPLITSHIQQRAFTLVDWTRLEDAASGIVRENTITWSKTQIGSFERLPPQQDGSIEFSIPTTLASTEINALRGFQVIVEAGMKFVGKTEVNRSISTAPISFRFRTDASLATEARYYSEEGILLGNGPLPPVIGKTTRYRIFWDITKSTHELQWIHVSAILAKNVTWPGISNTSAGEIAYNEATRRVTWMLNRMPQDVQTAHAVFDIDLTPSTFDVGRFAELLSDIRFEAVDADIGEQVVRSKPPITTDLQNDEGARSKGVVRKS